MKLSRIWNCVNIAATMLLLVSELSLRLKKNCPDVRLIVLGRLCSRNCQTNSSILFMVVHFYYVLIKDLLVASTFISPCKHFEKSI